MGILSWIFGRSDTPPQGSVPENFPKPHKEGMENAKREETHHPVEHPVPPAPRKEERREDHSDPPLGFGHFVPSFSDDDDDWF